jgi:DHA1 family bicyclomycin/chloramphenicol resistance-like MFS transporter
MMAVAFIVGQIAASFVNPQFSNGAWPMVVPMALAGVVLVLIAHVWLPRLLTHQHRKETP